MVTNDRKVSYPREYFSGVFVNTKGKSSYNRTCTTLTIPPYEAFYEKYTPNSRGFGSSRDWKPFQHYRRALSTPSVTSWVCRSNYGAQDFPASWNEYKPTKPLFGAELQYDYSSSQPYGDVGKQNVGLPAFIVPEDAYGNFIPLHAKHNQMLEQCFNALMPLVRAELSLPNAIYELRDFRSLGKRILGVYNSPSFQNAIRFLTDGLSSKRNRTFAEVCRKAAGAHLFYKFAIAPLVSDVASIHSAMSRTQARIAQLVREEGRTLVKHKSITWVEYVDPPPEQSNSGYLVSPLSWDLFSYKIERRVLYKPTVFHVEVQYNYNYTELARTHAQLLGHLDALGINLNPAIIWNAIPWTFVIDWVVGISRFLDGLKVENLTPKINIHRTLWSLKRERRIVCRMHTPTNAFGGYQSVTLPEVIETAYRRQTNVLTTSSLLTSGLNLTEFTLGASLAVCRTKHSNKAWSR